MSDEERQADEALHMVEGLIRKGSDSYRHPAFTVREAKDLAQAIGVLVDRRVALRERQILEDLRRMLEVDREPA